VVSEPDSLGSCGPAETLAELGACGEGNLRTVDGTSGYQLRLDGVHDAILARPHPDRYGSGGVRNAQLSAPRHPGHATIGVSLSSVKKRSAYDRLVVRGPRRSGLRQARSTYRKAIASSPELMKAWLRLGRVNQLLGR